jgi:hypothetical protein
MESNAHKYKSNNIREVVLHFTSIILVIIFALCLMSPKVNALISYNLNDENFL